ncbi:hypothetical protein [Streptomyces sp. NPDC001380]|uniref:hypothetical protein n=1 Tax=Streptomyces sp. NPDC001380 TaxID=3364566 RepID=UPI0036756175
MNAETIVLDRPGHARLPVADDETIDRAAAVQSPAAREVRPSTCDTGQGTARAGRFLTPGRPWQGWPAALPAHPPQDPDSYRQTTADQSALTTQDHQPTRHP